MASEVENQFNLKLLTWNINGIRSFEDFTEILLKSEADIICIQETKVTRDMLTESVAIVPGFTSYFAFSRLRSGYSGVATFCRSSATPAQSDSSLAQATSIMTGVSDLSEEFSSDELRGLDSEGRCVITRHSVLTSSGDTRHLVIINVYCPRADPERAERGKYQQQFYKALDIRANRLREAGDCVIICGDINTSHKEVDHCDPYEEFSDKPGRRFLTHFLRDLASEATLAEAADDDNQDDWVSTSVRLEERQFVDTFRIFHPDRKHAFTCWSTKGNCRSTNYGTRIDYVFASVNMTDVLADCDIQPDVLGSDHCPVLASFKLRPQPAARPPDNCTKYFKEFSGKQVKLSNFFIKTDKTSQDKLDQAVTAAKKPKTETKSKITSFFVAKDPKPKIEKSVEYKASVTEVQPKKSSQEFGNNNAKAAWGSIFKPLPPAPHCTKHKEQAVKRKVTKKGPNTGREFWGCSRGEGRADDPEARCDFFKWVK